MQKKSIEHSFPHPLEVIIETRSARYKDRSFWPEIQESEIVESSNDNNIIKEVRHTRLGVGQDNPIVKIFSSKYIEVIEESYYDLNENTFKLTATVNNFKSMLDCIETTLYTQREVEEKQHTHRKIDIGAKVKVPLLGRTFENILLNEFVTRSHEDQTRMMDYVTNVLLGERS